MAAVSVKRSILCAFQMATKTYTDEELNYFRLCSVITRNVPEGLRTVFKQQWNARYQATKGQWLDVPANAIDFKNKETPGNKRRNARLLSIMANGNTNEWDCTCLFYAILYSDCLGPFLNLALRKSVDELREIRNEVFAHTADGNLTDVDFHDAMRKILVAFKALGLNIIQVDEMKNQKSFLTDELSSIQQQLKDEKQRYAKFNSFCVLPPKPSHDTTDRADEVKTINHEMEKLRSTKKNETTVIYLSGNPGCGKSDIARQIGNEYFDKIPENQLKIVFTFDASSNDTLLQSYVDFAIRLSCDEDVVTKIATSKDLSQEEKINQMKSLINPKVQIYSSWLIIVDNVNDLGAVSKYLPQAGEKTSGDGQMLVTTQDSQAIPLGSYTYHYPSLKEGMKEDDAVTLLAQISGTTGDRDTLLNVASALDFQPLALACAAVYMQQVSQSDSKWEKYLLKLQEGKREATEKAFVKTTQTYKSGMTAAVKLALERVTSEDKIMMHAFQFLSVIANEPIPLKYVVQHVMNCMSDEDKDLVAAHISSSSLVISSEDGEEKVVRVHQVVYHGLQKLFENDEIDVMKLMTVFENLSSFKKVYKATKSEIIATRPFAPHFVVLSRKLEHPLQHSDQAVESPLITDCVFKAGCISLVHDNYKACEILLRVCLSTQEHDCNSVKQKSFDGKQTSRGNLNAALATTHKSLGHLYIQQRNFQKAKTHLKAALVVEEKLQEEEDHTELVVTLKKLGFCLQQLGENGKAKPYLKRALLILEKDRCKNYPLLAGILINMVKLHQDQGKMEKAKAYCERVLELEQYLYGSEDSQIVEVLNDLGVRLSRFQDEPGAIFFYEKSLKIMEGIYHADHSRMVLTLRNLGISLMKLRRFEDAKCYLERALSIQEKGNDENSLELACTLDALGCCLLEDGQHEKAQAYLERALSIREKGNNDNDAKLTATLNNLAFCLNKQGQYEKPQGYLDRARPSWCSIL